VGWATEGAELGSNRLLPRLDMTNRLFRRPVMTAYGSLEPFAETIFGGNVYV
jgi:hypothetical protein